MNRGGLLVDDEESVLKAMSRLFRYSGYSPHATTRGEEGVQVLERENIGICFLDLRMPTVHGFAVCRAIKPYDPSLPVYAVSGHIDAYDRKELVEAGFDDSFPNPFDSSALLDACEKAFERPAA